MLLELLFILLLFRLFLFILYSKIKASFFFKKRFYNHKGIKYNEIKNNMLTIFSKEQSVYRNLREQHIKNILLEFIHRDLFEIILAYQRVIDNPVIQKIESFGEINNEEE